MKRLLNYAWPLTGGLAAWAHCLFGDDRMARWLRVNAEHEPDIVA